IPFSSDSSFLYKTSTYDYLDDPWHFHREYELILIEKSSGTKFIGDNVSYFGPGNLSLIESNIPHLLRNHAEYHSGTQKQGDQLTYIHFTINFLGEHFFDIPEMKMIRRLLEKPSLALEIHGKTRDYTVRKLQEMSEQRPEQRLLSLLEILIRLSRSNDL